MSPAILWKRERCVSSGFIYAVSLDRPGSDARPAPAAHSCSRLSVTRGQVAAGWPPACEERGELPAALRFGLALLLGREMARGCPTGGREAGIACRGGGRAERSGERLCSPAYNHWLGDNVGGS